MPRMAPELRLARMRRLLAKLGDPHRAYRIIHVAGTKGKGSTACMIEAALRAAGHRTALFCSPHLHRLEERFTTLGQPASPRELVDLVADLKPIVAEFDAGGSLPRRPLTFFEITTALGLLHFARSGARVVVLEVGLGGRLDSTNAVRADVAVITSISKDHTKQLGDTLAAIATEKAGILKRRCQAVSGVRGAAALDAIQKIALQRFVQLKQIDRDFWCHYAPPTPPLTQPTPGVVSVKTWRKLWKPTNVPLLGAHQATNAAVALATLDALADLDPRLSVTEPAVAAGWAALRVPARVEVFPGAPSILIDGAHNVASAQALADTLRSHFPPTSRTLAFGTTRDKDLPGQLRALLPLFDRVVATRYLENPRAIPAREVVDACARLGHPGAIETNTPRDALEVARASTPPNGLIIVTGSMFLAAETRAILLGNPGDGPPSPT